MGIEGLTAGAVARHLGVAVTTLRTWHQRYGLGPSHHVPGQHRRYTSEDMSRLQVMRRLTALGVAPAEAAAWARRVPMVTDVSPPAPSTEDQSPIGPGPAGHSPAVDTHWPPEADQSDSTSPGPSAERASAPWPTPALELKRALEQGRFPESHEATSPAPTPNPGQTPKPNKPKVNRLPPGLTTMDAVWPELAGRKFVARDGGAHTLHTGRAGPAARGLARAAMRLDGPAMRDILEMAVTARGVVAAWDDVILPVLIGIGERHAATGRFIEVEHLISRGVTEVLGAVTRPPSTQLPRVLLAAADEEQHTLPMEALAAALAQAGVPSRFLGGRVPPRALSDAVARTGPAAVVLWSQVPSTGNPEQWVHLLSGGHRPVLAAAAGPGWPVAELPADVTTFANLTEAVRLVSMAALPADQPNKPRSARS